MMSGRKRDRKCSEQACNVRSYRANVESVGSGRVAGSSPKIRQNKLAIVGGHQNQPFWIGSRSGLESQGQMSELHRNIPSSYSCPVVNQLLWLRIAVHRRSLVEARNYGV